jgi:hypothetical protein
MAATSFPIAPTPASDTTLMTRAITFVATPGYAATVRLRLREGRFFTKDDRRPGVRSLSVNEEFVRRICGVPLSDADSNECIRGKGRCPPKSSASPGTY